MLACLVTTCSGVVMPAALRQRGPDDIHGLAGMPGHGNRGLLHRTCLLSLLRVSSDGVHIAAAAPSLLRWLAAHLHFCMNHPNQQCGAFMMYTRLQGHKLSRAGMSRSHAV